jgi:anthranilate/para-aminobenzoate synthase component I
MSTRTDIATETPFEAYLRLRGDGGSFLLESVEHGRLGRHSFVGRGSRIVSFEEAETCVEPVVGYLAYDHVIQLEPTVPLPAAGPPLPESRFIVADELIRFDHGEDTPPLPLPPPAVHAPVTPSPEYEELVRHAKEHIVAGDVFQVVLSQRVERPTTASAVELYRALRRVNPSPYLFLLELDGLALIGSSPETLVKVEDGRASVNPIAGTAAPGNEEQLLHSDKDRAEHVMLVDLGRNDLSRVCEPGTVRVLRFMEVERFSHVSHLV